MLQLTKRIVVILLLFLAGILVSDLLAQTGLTTAHDPQIIRQNQTYYLFHTGFGITVKSSGDLENWTVERPVFPDSPEWTDSVVDGFRNHIWAPDINYVDGTYYLYYSVSSFGSNRSAIGVATNSTLHPDDRDYEWIDHGIIVESVPGRDMWNAIDPSLVFDQNGTPWLIFGSFWMGLKIVRLKENLLETADNPAVWHTIASRHRYWKLPDASAGNEMNGAIEAPFIYRKDGYFYLFASWDMCCRREESTYKIVAGRSRHITGPYLDRQGRQMNHGGGTLVARGEGRWAAVGHNSVFVDEEGNDYLVFHGYDREDEGRSKLMIKPVNWDDGWPTVDITQ